MKTDFVQSGGFLTIDTPFGTNDLLLDGLEGAEGISELFKFNLFMRSGSSNLSASTIVGKTVTVTMEVEGGSKRYIHGIVSRFIQSGYDVDFATYQAELVPSLWLLSLSRDRKIYQTKSILDIVKAVLGEGSITFTGWKSWVNLQIINDPGKGYALVGAILAISGLLISLFTRQRRIWIKQGRKTQIAGLAKNGIPGLEDEIKKLVKELGSE